jgi:hypothetical protein
MSLWREDLSTCGPEEIQLIQTENSNWGKAIRSKNSSFVNSRLANEITHAEYLLNRQLLKELTFEYLRRAAHLNYRSTDPMSARALP